MCVSRVRTRLREVVRCCGIRFNLLQQRNAQCGGTDAGRPNNTWCPHAMCAQTSDSIIPDSTTKHMGSYGTHTKHASERA